ncbi:MAG: hypothetical protein KAS93_02935 [Gammaproteobacteria bacterium]|nr:hypothetical protein [Gammaproteobacteria bacterium]
MKSVNKNNAIPSGMHISGGKKAERAMRMTDTDVPKTLVLVAERRTLTE